MVVDPFLADPNTWGQPSSAAGSGMVQWLFRNRLERRLKPTLRYQSRDHRTSENRCDEDRILPLIDNLIGETKQR